MEKENVPPSKDPPLKKRRLSLSLKGKSRFKETSEDDLAKLSKVQVAKNTDVSTRWAMKNLTEWYVDYNARHPENPCPEEVILPTCSASLLNQWLCVFISETRNRSGEPYPPKSLYALLTGILRHMRGENPHYPNFLEKNSPVFSTFTITLDNIFKGLRTSGVGADSKHTEAISTEEEDALWSSGVLNVISGQGLLRAMFYYNGKCFCLRGGQEHRDLQLSQIKRDTDPDRYTYSENASKNKKGGIAQMRMEHKTVTSFADPEAGSRCHVYLLDLYISKLPKEAIEKNLFYCRPLPSTPINASKPWFTAVPIGRNQLSKMVCSMCEEAGIGGNKTNHSLRVTGASALFDAGVPERIIQSRTGHRCLDSLRVYERVTDEQTSRVSKILSGNKKRFETENNSSSDTSNIKPLEQSSGTANYNNCTINVYSVPSNPPPCYPSIIPPSVPAYPSLSTYPPPSVPAYPPLSLSAYPQAYFDETHTIPDFATDKYGENSFDY